MKYAVMKDAALLQKAKDGDSDALATVFAGSEGFIRWCVGRALGPRHTWPARLEYEDALQEGRCALHVALRAWNPTIAELTTLADLSIRRALWRWRKTKGTLLHVSATAYPEYRDPATVSIDDPNAFAQVTDTSALGVPDIVAERLVEDRELSARTHTAEDVAALLDEARVEGALGKAQTAIRVAEWVCATPRQRNALFRRLVRRAQQGPVSPPSRARAVSPTIPVVAVAPQSRRCHPAMPGLWQLAIDTARLA